MSGRSCGIKSESFQLLVGASPKQRMKCGAVAYDGKLCLSFASAMAENRLPEYFFRFLEKQGIPVELESNGNLRPGT